MSTVDPHGQALGTYRNALRAQRLHSLPPEGGGPLARAARGNLPSEQGEREGEAPSGLAGGGGDASPYNSMIPTLIYDANCHLCESIKNGLSRWGRNREIRFLHFEDPQVCALQPDLHGIDYLDAIRFIDGGGKSWKGADAVRHFLKILPFGRPIAWVLSLPGMYYLAGKAYVWVASNRYWIFGRTR